MDVRDVAIAHVNALEQLPGLNGRRFVLTNDAPCMEQGALELAKVATRIFPAYRFDSQPRYSPTLLSVTRALSQIPLVGSRFMTEVERLATITPIHWDNTVARRDLGVDFRPLDTTIKDGIESIVELGVAKLKLRSSL